MKVLLTGPILGYNRGREKSQAEYLIELLSQKGIEVVWASKYPQRIKRAQDIIKTIIRHKDAKLGIIMVYSFGAFLYADIASYLMHRFHIPIVFWLHGGALPEFVEKHKKWVKRVLNRGKILIAPSFYLATYFRRYGYEVEVIRNIIHIEDYPYHTENNISPKLLWMRTFHPIYNPKMALYAHREVLKVFPEAFLTMAGVDRGIMKDMIKLSKELGISDKVSFPGFLDKEKKYEYFKSHFIYLHTNFIDNTPVSVIEALAGGLIVIATDVGGIPYLLKHKYNALLVKPDDYKKMADYVIGIIKGKIDLKGIRTKGRELAMEFDAKNVIEQWLSLLNQRGC